MPQLVFEFRAPEIGPVVEAITRLVPACPTVNAVADFSLRYEPTQEDLNWAARQLSEGQASSFVLHPQDGGIRYAMLHGPGVGGEERPGYMGTVEYTRSDYSHIWSALLKAEGLCMVCLGDEEGVEFTAEQLTAETFLWDDFFLVIGAVRRHRGGDWIPKHGPIYFPSAGE
jgi:hypothetical protein